MTKNEQLNDELYGYDFEVYQVDYDKTEETVREIKTFHDIEHAFEKVDRVCVSIGKTLKKKNPKSTVVYESTEFGKIISVGGNKVFAVLIRDLKIEKVSISED